MACCAGISGRSCVTLAIGAVLPTESTIERTLIRASQAVCIGPAIAGRTLIMAGFAGVLFIPIPIFTSAQALFLTVAFTAVKRRPAGIDQAISQGATITVIRADPLAGSAPRITGDTSIHTWAGVVFIGLTI